MVDLTPRLAPLLASSNELRRWHANVARGSQITADVYARRLANFCGGVGISPAAFAQLPPNQRKRLLLDFVGREERRGMQGEYVRSSVKSVNSWLEYNDLPKVSGVKIRGVGRSPRREEEELPSAEDVRAVRSAASQRDAIVIGLMAYSGVRPQAIGNYTGTDGIRLRDLPDLDPETLRFRSRPPRLLVRTSKNGLPYTSFLAGPVADDVEAYLRGRRAAGERLSPETDLVHPIRASKPFLRAVNVGDAARAAFENAGFMGDARPRPYVLRHYFEAKLAVAEGERRVTHEFREFFAGHKVDIGGTYALGHRHLPTELLQQLRDAYARCEPFLLGETAVRVDVHAAMRREMLQLLGYAEKALERIDFSDADAVREFVRLHPPGATRAQQTTVPESEVDRLQALGWTVQVQLQSGKVVMDPPRGGTVPATSPPSPPGPNGGFGRLPPR